MTQTLCDGSCAETPHDCWQVTQRKDVRLYWGTHSPEHTAFQDRIPTWESQGIKVVPVFSESSGTYVQDVYAKVWALSP